ncbi:hypothetical protein ACFONH_17085 [Streptomonospora nanhaiensis]|uniref:hypothetical protein n=1 Tax=Streptomonospora nanhaiensis TaxID=1323731 RepID=UPI001C99609F|nr:hypothetical protein [Streptomonospora nanhaiensis]MBX9388715.1 hypothetical protein [Streptomonospora nanhaiensis]
MTYDVVALVREAPDVRALVDAMVDAHPDLKVVGAGDGAVIQLCDGSGRALLSIEAAQEVRVPGEVERLLGPDIAAQLPDPCWWIEARAAGADPGPAGLAHRFAGGLVQRLGGLVWSPRPAPPGALDPLPAPADQPPPPAPDHPGAVGTAPQPHHDQQPERRDN